MAVRKYLKKAVSAGGHKPAPDEPGGETLTLLHTESWILGPPPMGDPLYSESWTLKEQPTFTLLHSEEWSE